MNTKCLETNTQKMDRLEAENARLDNIVTIQAKQIERLVDDRDAAKAENARLEARLLEIEGACHAGTASQQMQLGNIIATLRAENARLAAAFQNVVTFLATSPIRP